MPAREVNEGLPKRVAFYIRFSSWNQDAQNSKEGQFNALQAYANANGMVVTAVYTDEGVSGRRDDRQELNRMMRDARARQRPFDEVLIWKFDRLGRRASTVDRRATELENLGIHLTAVQQPLEGKPSVVRFVRNLLGNMSEFFSDNLGEDIARGKLTSSSHGVWTNSSVPFGFRREYRMDRGRMRPFLVPDPETSWIIVKTFAHYLEGTGTKKITDIMNDERVPGPTPKPWSQRRTTKILKNIAYAGFVHVGKRSIYEGHELLVPVPAMEIITLDEYNRAQEIMASHSIGGIHPREVASRHLLSGLVYCDECDCKMSPTGGERSYYNCYRRRIGMNRFCETPNPRGEHLDEAVLGHILDRLLIPENTERIIDMVARSETQTTVEVEEELRNISLEIENQKETRKTLLEFLKRQDIVEADIAESIVEIRQTLTRLESNALAARAKLSNEKALTSDPKKVAAYVGSLDTYLRDANVDLAKEILREIIVEIRVSPGEEENTANIKIRYRIPAPPQGWTETADVEELLLRKNKRSLESPTHAEVYLKASQLARLYARSPRPSGGPPSYGNIA